jgi:hypothetical protein
VYRANWYKRSKHDGGPWSRQLESRRWVLEWIKNWLLPSDSFKKFRGDENRPQNLKKYKSNKVKNR